MRLTALTEEMPARLWVALAALAMALWYAPWWPFRPRSELDTGWAIGLAIGCERGLAFGRDLLFTYGPLGCWATRYYWPDTHPPSLVLCRIVADLSAAGFLLSPDLRDLAALEAWARGSWPGSDRASRIRVMDDRGRLLRACFEFSTSPFPSP
jgi:hypothetical protein